MVAASPRGAGTRLPVIPGATLKTSQSRAHPTREVVAAAVPGAGVSRVPTISGARQRMTLLGSPGRAQVAVESGGSGQRLVRWILGARPTMLPLTTNPSLIAVRVEVDVLQRISGAK